jgi:hypothetical protein
MCPRSLEVNHLPYCFDQQASLFIGFAAKGWHKQLRLQADPKTHWKISIAYHRLPVSGVEDFLIVSSCCS